MFKKSCTICRHDSSNQSLTTPSCHPRVYCNVQWFFSRQKQMRAFNPVVWDLQPSNPCVDLSYAITRHANGRLPRLIWVTVHMSVVGDGLQSPKAVSAPNRPIVPPALSLVPLLQCHPIVKDRWIPLKLSVGVVPAYGVPRDGLIVEALSLVGKPL